MEAKYFYERINRNKSIKNMTDIHALNVSLTDKMWVISFAYDIYFTRTVYKEHHEHVLVHRVII